MRHRLLVMNGQRLVQCEREGQWATEKIDKADGVKPGIYNIYLARDADTMAVHEGPILYVDGEHVYQQVGKASFVRHLVTRFGSAPGTGVSASIKYGPGGDAALTSAAGRQHKHRIA